MPDKSVNININYNVRTNGVQQAEAQVSRAEAATQKLNAATKNFSKQSSSGYKFTAKSIEGMEQELAKLQQQIKLTSTSDSKRLSKLSADYRSAKKQLDDFNKSLFTQSKAVNDASKSTQGLGQQFGQLFTAIKAVITVGIVRQLFDTNLEMARLAGNIQGVNRAFLRAFPNGELLLNDLRAATRNTITDFQLMQRTLQATNLGVSVNELGVLFEFAAARAQQTGESIDYLVDSIVRGIGRKSVLVLDNLGLSTTRLKEEFDGAAIASKSVAEVTRGVANIARVELEKMGGYVETSATKVDQLSTSWQELRASIAELVTDTGLIDYFTEATKAGRLFIESINDPGAMDRAIAGELALADAARIRNRAQQEAAGDAQKQTDILQQEINSRVQIVGRYNDKINELQQIIKRGEGFGFPGFNKENIEGAKRFNELVDQYGYRAKEIFEQEIENAREQLNGRVLNKEVIEQTIDLLYEQLKVVERTTEEQTQQKGIIETLEEEIKNLNEAIRKAPTLNIAENLSQQLDVAQRALERFKASISQAPPTVDLTEISEGVQFTTANVREGFTVINEFSRNVTELFEEGTDAAEDLNTKVLRLIDTLSQVKPIPPPIPGTFLDDLEDAVSQAKEVLIGTGIDVFAQQITDLSQVQVEELNVQLDNLRSFYDQQQRLAEGNEGAKKQLQEEERQRTRELQIEIARQQKESNRFSIIVDTAAGIIKAFATLPTPAAVVQSAIIAALGASQLAIVNRTPIPRFAKGVIGLDGPGNGTSDSIMIRASKGESIITADATRRSKKLLGDINARKIDDRVLKDMQVTDSGVKYVGMDPKPIVEAIKGQKQADFEMIGSVLYRTMDNGKGYKRRVRSKIMGL